MKQAVARVPLAPVRGLALGFRRSSKGKGLRSLTESFAGGYSALFSWGPPRLEQVAPPRTWSLEMSDSQAAILQPYASRFVYDRVPMLVYWEMTRSCDLACVHCRAEAMAKPHPLELSTEEGRALLREIRAFDEKQPPHLVLTGGDPLKRADLYELIAEARAMGIGVSVTPAATPRLTKRALPLLKESGVSSLALSLDGSDAGRHDSFRGVPGTFDLTVAAVRETVALGIPLQINTMVTSATARDLPAIYELLATLGVDRWALFFLIPTGRGRSLSELSPGESERLLTWLCELSESSETPFVIKTTEAHHVRRLSYQRMHSRGATDEAFLRSPFGRGLGVRDGNGIVFVSHVGEIFPSGFLPIACGNIRSSRLTETYRTGEPFRKLRDADALKGKCGRCTYRLICGGSRARAYATTGDPLESDALCLYPTILFRD